MFPIHIIPEGPLEASILIPIFVGMLVMTSFSETYGWGFTGLVVPGYLAPILIVSPYSAGVILIEAILVYGLTYLFSERLSKWGHWAPLAGRERFAFMVLISVLVRLLFEALALPGLGLLAQHWAPALEHRETFTAVGLVVTPLLANMLWKPGLMRGLKQAAIVTGLTYLFVLFLLIPLTNFSLVRFHFMYETAALDLAASPKTYMILLTGMLLALAAHQHLNWRFGGILLPGLLAVGLLSPLSLLTTLIEAGAIWALAKLLFRLPFLQKAQPTGPRLFVMLCGLGLLIKLAVGFLGPWSLSGDPGSGAWPSAPLEHLFGYGYLLSALLAKRIWEEASMVPVAGPVTVTACLSFLLGTAFGWGSLWISPSSSFLLAEGTAKSPSRPTRTLNTTAYDLLIEDFARLPRAGSQHRMVRMLPSEAQLFQDLIKRLDQATRVTEGRLDLAEAYPLANALGLELLEIHDLRSGARFAYLREFPGQERTRGWGMALFRFKAKNRLLLEVPRPLSEPRTPEAATVLMELTGAHALLVPGGHYQSNSDGTSDVLRWSRTPFRLAHATLSKHDVIEIRRQAAGTSTLFWSESELPDLLRLKDFEKWLGRFDLSVLPDAAPADSRELRLPRRRRFCTLAMAPTAVRSLIASRFLNTGYQEQQFNISPFRAEHMASYLSRTMETEEQRSSLRSRQPTSSELLYFDQQIFTPLLEAAERFTDAKDPTLKSSLQKSLRPIAHAARRLGYHLEIIRHPSENYFVALTGKDNAIRKGRFAIRFGQARPLHILVPYSLDETEAGRAAAEYFVSLEARAVSFGNASHTSATFEERASWNRPPPLGGFYHLVHQIIQRRSWANAPVLNLEFRRAPQWPPTLIADALLREGNVIGGARAFSKPMKSLLKDLNKQGLTTAAYKGDKHITGFSVAGNRQFEFNTAHAAGAFGTLWLAPSIRSRFRSPKLSDREEEAFRTLGFREIKRPLSLWMAEGLSSDLVLQPAADAWGLLSDPAREAIAFAQDRNLARLEIIFRACRDRNIRPTLIKESERGLPILALELLLFPKRHIRLLINLRPFSNHIKNAPQGKWDLALTQFLTERPAALILGAPLPEHPEPSEKRKKE